MKRQSLALLIILLSNSSVLFSQLPQIDSLKLALKAAKHDTTRCNILSILIETASDEEWPAFNQQLKTLAEKNIAGHANPINFYLKHLATSLHNIGLIYDEQGNISKGLEYYHKSLKIQEDIRDKDGMATSLNNIGFIYWNQGDISRALGYYYKSLKIREELGDKDGIAISLNNIATIYYNQGDIKKALEYYHKSLKIQEDAGDKDGIATSLNNIGFVYQNQDDISKALEYYDKSLKILEELGDKKGIATSLNNVGVIYQNQGKLSKALEYYRKSLKIREEIKEKNGVAESLNNIGAIYDRQGETTNALEHFHNSLKIYEELGDKRGMAISLNNIADCMIKKGLLGEAILFADRSMQAAKEIGFPGHIKSTAGTLKTIYKKQNKFKEALKMYELEITMRDSIANEANKKAGIKSQLKYEYEKKSAADSVKNAEQQKVKDAQLTAQTASLKQERFQRYSLVVGLLIVLGGLGFVINRFRVTNKQKKIIEEQKIIVDQAFEKLHEKNKEVMDSIYYARRIQRALITSEHYFNKNLNKLKARP